MIQQACGNEVMSCRLCFEWNSCFRSGRMSLKEELPSWLDASKPSCHLEVQGRPHSDPIPALDSCSSFHSSPRGGEESNGPGECSAVDVSSPPPVPEEPIAPTPVFTMPPPTAPPSVITTVYQMLTPLPPAPPLSNVYVSNLNTNVNMHGFVPTYAPHMYTEAPHEVAPRGNGAVARRSRGGKPGIMNKRVAQESLEAPQTYPAPQVFAMNPLAIPFTQQAPAYFTPSTHTNPHPTAQHATGTPIFMPSHGAVMYPTPMYSTYPPPPMYSTAPRVQCKEEPSTAGYQQQHTREDEYAQANILSSVVVNNSNIVPAPYHINTYQTQGHKVYQSEAIGSCEKTVLNSECVQASVSVTINDNISVSRVPLVPYDKPTVDIRAPPRTEIETLESHRVDVGPVSISAPIQSVTVLVPSQERPISANVPSQELPVSANVPSQELPISASVPSQGRPVNASVPNQERPVSASVPSHKQPASVPNKEQLTSVSVSCQEQPAENITVSASLPVVMQSQSVIDPSPMIMKSHTVITSSAVLTQSQSANDPPPVMKQSQSITTHSPVGIHSQSVTSSPPKVTQSQPITTRSVVTQSESGTTSSPAATHIRPTTTPSPVATQTRPAGKSWASLFKGDGSKEPVPVPEDLPKPTPHVELYQSVVTAASSPSPLQMSALKAESQDAPSNSMPQLPSPCLADDPNLHRLGEFLLRYQLDHKANSLQPRGLTNRSNWCYINSTLQALLACPPFYNLMKAFPLPSCNNSAKSSTPIIDSIVQFVNEFVPLSSIVRVNRKEKAQRKDDGSAEVQTGAAFEPSYIYKMLNNIRSDTFKVEGRQEDAEEFLSCLLNALNDEMLEVIKLVEDTDKTSLSNGDISTNGDTSLQSQDEDDTEWKVMGPKNKGSITRRADFGHTPISDIFRGQLRSRVQRAGDHSTDNVQPFFTLQLDIELEGVTCSKTNQEIEAWQQVTLEELPLVLVLHLKWFDYKLDGCSKIVKSVEFPIDLKMDGKIMTSTKKYSSKEKQYKLFAVVYHDGKEATKGHYITDVFHVGYGSWVRYDDNTVKVVQENQVLHPRGPRVPYLLYYRRCDTIGTNVMSSDKTR
uniref:ubiquitinyl hydrolase 1 n=1 Tax=Timema poppense TaxID=170557 RepID=A0A7R9GXK7_TIMPO|nr:unnamed protein product [Timema poppensis]